MKSIYILILTLLFSSLLFSQERMILRTNGEQIKLNHKKDLREAIREVKIKRSDGTLTKNLFIDSNNKATGFVDTLTWRNLGGYFNTNFGFFGQDLMMMWFEAPTDMTIKGIGFSCPDDSGYIEDGATVGLRLVKLNWTAEQLKNFSGATQQGYYPSAGNGFNNIDAFGEMATGNWVSIDENNPLPPWSNHENPDSNSFAYDLWSDSGAFWPVVPVISESSSPVYNWLDFASTGLGDAEIMNGEVFAIVAMNNGVNLDSSRIGFWADNTLGIPGWKFYQNGRSDATVDPGWWTRMYTWDFAVAVDIPPGPHIWISSMTKLPTTLSTDARTVEVTIEESNPSGGESIIAEVDLVYTINDGDKISVSMVTDGNIYSAQIPGQSYGTEVRYWISVTDVNGNIIATSYLTYNYHIFKVQDKLNLVVFNGFDSPLGYPQQYYWGPDTSYNAEWTYDAWAYGPLTKELVDNYTNIFEICTNGPLDYNREVIAEWLSEDGFRKYFLAGEEWLGADNGYTDQDYLPGSFEYDVLGISHSYNDISYDGTSGQELPTKIMPQEGTLIGGAMFAKVAEINAIDSSAIDSVLYNPMVEIGVGSNWLDGFEVVDSAEVFMKAETRGIAGAPAIQEVNIGVNRWTVAGNKVVFMAYDPISIGSTPTNYWLGRGNQSNTYQAMEWFAAILLDVENNGVVPEEYTLSQNYPNPFNPSTTIKFSIPSNVKGEMANTKLVVFDILGREIATLVNKQQKAGNYEVTFDASNLTSGIYFYRLQSGGFIESRKMVLLK